MADNKEPKSYLTMSDEDFLKEETPAEDAPSTEEGTDNSGDDQNDDDTSKDDETNDAGDDDQTGSDDDNKDEDDTGKESGTKEEDSSSDAGGVDDDAGDDDDKDTDEDAGKGKKEIDEKGEKKKEPDEKVAEAEFAKIGKQVMEEFTANGRPMKMKSAEDIIRLMQMGANYHKKMAGMKPAMKTLKLLDNHGLLDPTKLNFLIDLSQKKPEAIAQLLKDSKLDPMEIDTKGEEDYVPQNREVSDTEVDLDEVLSSISHNASYNRTLTVIGDEWDKTSRTAISKDPEVIRIINAHMENGVYDQVADAIAYERSMGKLSGVSDYDAYQRVGAHMNENKMFKSSAGGAKDEGSKSQDTKKPQDNAEDKLRKERKKAASSSRQKPAQSKADPNYNPLEMSDEDFIKLNKLSV